MHARKPVQPLGRHAAWFCALLTLLALTALALVHLMLTRVTDDDVINAIEAMSPHPRQNVWDVLRHP